MYAQAAVTQGILTDDTIRETLTHGLEHRFQDQRVLVLIPDHTRTVPLPLLFRLLAEILHDARQIDVMVALGTHLPLDDDALNTLVGITPDERAGRGVKRNKHMNRRDKAEAGLWRIAAICHTDPRPAARSGRRR